MAVVAAWLALSGPAATAAARDDAAFNGASWLAHQQKSNGAFFSTSQPANDTAVALASLVAGGVGGDVVGKALDHIRRTGKARASKGAFTGQIIAGIVAGGADPRKFGGVDYVKRLKSQYRDGAFDTKQLFPNLLGANGLLAAGEDLPDEAVDYITSHACDGGGFGYEERCSKGPDADTTAWAISVLTAAGGADDAVDRARDWLLHQQHADGGFGFTKDLPTGSDSTGLALSAITALGEDAESAPWRQSDGDDPVKALLELQDASGGFRAQQASAKPNGMSTNNAVPGLAGVAYPVPAGEGAPPKPPKTPKPTPGETNAPSSGDETRDDEPSSRSGETAEATPTPDPADDDATPTPDTTGSANASVALTNEDPDTDAPFADSASEPLERTSSGSGMRTAMAVTGIAAGGAGIALGVRAIRRRRIL